MDFINGLNTREVAQPTQEVGWTSDMFDGGVPNVGYGGIAGILLGSVGQSSYKSLATPEVTPTVGLDAIVKDSNKLKEIRNPNNNFLGYRVGRDAYNSKGEADFKEYLPTQLYDTEHINYQKQGFWEKAAKATGSFIAKTYYNFQMNTTGLVMGIKDGIVSGSFSAVFNNDYLRQLQKEHAELDETLRIYKQHDYDKYSTWDKVTDGTFYFTQVPDMLSFVAGAYLAARVIKIPNPVGGLAAKLATGNRFMALSRSGVMAGSSAETLGTMAGSKGLLKNLFRGMFKGGKPNQAIATIQNMSDDAIRAAYGASESTVMNVGAARNAMIQAYKRAAFAKNAVSYTNDALISLTMASNEAGFEARDHLDRVVADYLKEFEEKNGRLPEDDEMVEFLTDAQNSTNSVYAANLPILLYSNMFTMARFVGLKHVPKGLISSGAIKLAENGTLKLAKHNLARKIISNIASYSEAAVAEGLVEEGGQYLASEWQADLLDSMYDGGDRQAMYSSADSFARAFDKTLNSKEGQENIIIGGLFGVAMGQGGRFVAAKGGVGSKFKALFGNEYRDARARKTELVDAYNKGITKASVEAISPEQRLLFRKMGGLSAQSRLMEKGDLRSRNLAQLQQQSLLREMDMEDIAVEAFNAQIDAMDDATITASGVSSDKIAEYKQFIKDEYARQFKDNKEALNISDSLAEGVFSKKEFEALGEMGLHPQDYKMIMAAELTSGKHALENFKTLTKMMNDHLNNDLFSGNETLLGLFQDLETSKDENLIKLSETKDRLEKIREREKELQDVLARERDRRTVTKSNEIQKNAEVKNDELNKILDELKQLEEERIGAERDYNDLSFKVLSSLNQKQYSPFNKFVYGEGREGQVASERDLENFLERNKAISERKKFVKDSLNDPNVSEERKQELREWLEDLETIHKMMVDNKNFFNKINQNFRLRTDGRYAFSEAKGFTHKIRHLGRHLTDGELEALSDEEKAEWEALEEKISKNNLNAYDAWNLRANFRILKNGNHISTRDVVEELEEAEEETPSQLIDGYHSGQVHPSEFFGRIANILLEKGEKALSPFFKEVYADHKQEIDKMVEDLKLEEGDPMNYGQRDGQEVNTTIDRSISFKEAVKKIIDSFISSTNRLSKELVDKAKGNKPTEQEYERFRELHRKKTGRDAKGKMTDKATREKYKKEFEDNIEEYEALRDKINTWGVMMGTIANGVRLSDLLEFYDSLENGTDQNSPDDVIKQTEVNIDELLDEEESSASWQSTNKGRNFDVAQVYDLAMVSVNRDGNFVLHHFGIDNLLQEINDSHPNDSVEVFGVNDIGNTRTPYHSGTNNTYDGVEIRITKPDGSSETFIVRFDKQNNLVFSDALVPHLGSLRLMQIPSIRRNYQPLYSENGNGSFEQVKSTFDGGVDTNATREVKVGDTLTAEVDLDNPYNRRLFNNYHKALADNKGNAKAQAVVDAREALKNQMVVNLVDSKGRVVSVMKSNATAQDLQESATAPQMIDYRNKAVTQVINGVAKKGGIGGVVKLNNKMSVTVSSVMLGVPNVTVARDSEGNAGVTLNPLSQQAKKKVVDVGYMLDGKIHSKNHTKITAGYNLLGQYKKAEHKGRKIPLIFIKEDGKVVAYPAHLQSQGNLLQQFDEIIANNDPIQAAIKLNELMHQNGISTQLFGITPDMVSNNSSELEMARKMAEKAEKFNDPETWVGNTHTMEEILDRDIQVNLNMEGDAFAAPKLRFKFDGSIKPAQTIASPPSTSNSVSQIVPPAPPAAPSAPNTPNTPNNPTPPSTPNTPNTPDNKGKKKGKKGDNKADENKPYKEYKEGAPSFEYKGKKYNVVTYGERNATGFVEDGSDVILSYDSFYRDLGFQIAANKWAEAYNNKVALYLVSPEEFYTWEQQQKQSRPEDAPIVPPSPAVTPQSVEEGQRASQAVGNALTEIEQEDEQSGNQDNGQDPAKDKFFDGVRDYTPTGLTEDGVRYREVGTYSDLDTTLGRPHQISPNNPLVIAAVNGGQADTGGRSNNAEEIVRDKHGIGNGQSWTYLTDTENSRNMLDYSGFNDRESADGKNVSLPVRTLSDSHIEESKKAVDKFIDAIEEKLQRGVVVALPVEGFGVREGGKANFVQESPKVYRYFIEQLQNRLQLGDDFATIKNMKWTLYQSQVLGDKSLGVSRNNSISPQNNSSQSESFVDRATSFIRNLFGRRNRSC